MQILDIKTVKPDATNYIIQILSLYQNHQYSLKIGLVNSITINGTVKNVNLDLTKNKNSH